MPETTGEARRGHHIDNLPAALLAPLWLRPFPLQGWLRWYLGVAAGVLFGAAIALAAAVKADLAGKTVTVETYVPAAAVAKAMDQAGYPNTGA